MFCGSDIAKALGYANAPDSLKKHCKSDGIAKYDSVDNLGRKNILSFISESNVYRLITHSKLPNAEKFESWVFDEVLEIARGSRIVERFDEDECSQTPVTDNLGRQQNTYVVNKSGLYNVILHSDKEEAKPFKKWVTSEVLPSI